MKFFELENLAISYTSYIRKREEGPAKVRCWGQMKALLLTAKVKWLCSLDGESTLLGAHDLMKKKIDKNEQA